MKTSTLISARRSISSKHNNSNSESKPNYTKSFASAKKEELMKVINEAKQKLENVSAKFTFQIFVSRFS